MGLRLGEGVNLKVGDIDSQSGKRKTRTVRGEYFLFLLLQHVLPKGFRRSRSYGFLHPCSKRAIWLIQLVLRINPLRLFQRKARPQIRCPRCGKPMEIIKTMIPPQFLRSCLAKTLVTGGTAVM